MKQEANLLQRLVAHNLTMKADDDLLKNKAKLLLSRLERLSADSKFAHQASGIRGQILRHLQRSGDKIDLNSLKNSIELGYHIVNSAAKEIPDYESLNGWEIPE